jgi:hypothetical protein
MNSHYSLRWYHTFSRPMFESLRDMRRPFPRMHILHPPVTLMKPAGGDGSDAPEAVAASLHKNIVMVGRFFAGRQSKGHPHAIRIFSQLVPHVPQDTQLIMVGNIMPGQQAYIDGLHASIKELGLEKRVSIEVSVGAGEGGGRGAVMRVG